jgi:hypothetical protein
MSIEKYSQFISLHEEKTKTIGLRALVEADLNSMSKDELYKKHAHHFSRNSENYPETEGDLIHHFGRNDSFYNPFPGQEKHQKTAKEIEHHVKVNYGGGALRQMVAKSKRVIMKAVKKDEIESGSGKHGDYENMSPQQKAKHDRKYAGTDRAGNNMESFDMEQFLDSYLSEHN